MTAADHHFKNTQQNVIIVVHTTHTHTTVRKTNFIQYKNDMQFYIYTYNMYIEVMYEKEKPVLFMYFDLYVQE